MCIFPPSTKVFFHFSSFISGENAGNWFAEAQSWAEPGSRSTAPVSRAAIEISASPPQHQHSTSSALGTSEAGTGSVSAAAGVAPRPVTLSLATANIPQTLAALFQIDRILQPQKYLLLPRKYLLLLRALPCEFVSGTE